MSYGTSRFDCEYYVSHETYFEISVHIEYRKRSIRLAYRILIQKFAHRPPQEFYIVGDCFLEIKQFTFFLIIRNLCWPCFNLLKLQSLYLCNVIAIAFCVERLTLSFCLLETHQFYKLCKYHFRNKISNEANTA